ncbi:MAG: hypothetical protein ABIH18_01365 [Candidatus Omnitrophota bacterium]
MTVMTVLIWALGFSVLSHFIVLKNLSNKLRDYIRGYHDEKHGSNKLTPTMGCIERIIYTLSFYYGKQEIIIGLFVLMAVNKLLIIQKMDESKEIIDGESKNKVLIRKIGERINLYFVLSFVSLFLGISGGVIIKYLKY